MTEFFWRVNGVQTATQDGLSGVVTSIQWVCIGRTPQWLENISGTTALGAADPANFVALEAINQTTALGFLFAVLDRGDVEARVQKLIDAHDTAPAPLVEIPD